MAEQDVIAALVEVGRAQRDRIAAQRPTDAEIFAAKAEPTFSLNLTDQEIAGIVNGRDLHVECDACSRAPPPGKLDADWFQIWRCRKNAAKRSEIWTHDQVQPR
jgi:hypothetical protein